MRRSFEVPTSPPLPLHPTPLHHPKAPPIEPLVMAVLDPRPHRDWEGQRKGEGVKEREVGSSPMTWSREGTEAYRFRRRRLTRGAGLGVELHRERAFKLCTDFSPKVSAIELQVHMQLQFVCRCTCMCLLPVHTGV